MTPRVVDATLTLRDDPQHPASLTSPQERALLAMVSGANVADAARVAGVDRATCSRWLHHDPAFRHELRCARETLRRECALAAGAIVGKALATVGEVLADRTAPAVVRLRAADIALRTVAGSPVFDVADDPQTDAEREAGMRRHLASIDEARRVLRIRSGDPEPAWSVPFDPRAETLDERPVRIVTRAWHERRQAKP